MNDAETCLRHISTDCAVRTPIPAHKTIHHSTYLYQPQRHFKKHALNLLDCLSCEHNFMHVFMLTYLYF